MQGSAPTTYVMLNERLDRLVRPGFQLFGRSWNAYLLWQCIGIVSAIAVVLSITRFTSLSSAVTAGILFLSAFIVVVLFKSAELFGSLLKNVEIFGQPYGLLFIWAGSGIYHFQFAILSSASLLLWLVDEPILPYLDLLAISLAIAQIFGRLGCLMVGCCHGRPHRWGVRYGDVHLEAGYVNYLQGVRLLPVQLLESIWLLFIAIVAAKLVLSGAAPGEALSWYVIAYGAGRFTLEFLRADTIRLYFWGFSEAQWTALLFTASIVMLELWGILDFHLWHVAAPLAIALTMLAIGLLRHFRKLERFELLHPYHLREFAEAVSWLYDLLNGGFAVGDGSANSLGSIEAATSLGVQLAAEANSDEHGCSYEYAISYRNQTMKEETARTLAALIALMKHPNDGYALSQQGEGVFCLSVGCDVMGDHARFV